MQFDKQTPRREITISEVTLNVISPFREGDVLNAEQANVLNQTLAENLRNNFAATVKATKEAAGGVENVDVSALQNVLNEYTKEYEFGARRSSGIAVNPIEKIAISLARDVVKKTLKSQGKDLKAFSAEQLTDLAKGAVAKYPHFMQKAEAIHAAKKEAGSEALDLVA